MSRMMNAIQNMQNTIQSYEFKIWNCRTPKNYMLIWKNYMLEKAPNTVQREHNKQKYNQKIRKICISIQSSVLQCIIFWFLVILEYEFNLRANRISNRIYILRL